MTEQTVDRTESIDPLVTLYVYRKYAHLGLLVAAGKAFQYTPGQEGGSIEWDGGWWSARGALCAAGLSRAEAERVLDAAWSADATELRLAEPGEVGAARRRLARRVLAGSATAADRERLARAQGAAGLTREEAHT